MEEVKTESPLQITEKQKLAIKRFSIMYFVFGLLLSFWLPIDNAFRKHFGYSITGFFGKRATMRASEPTPFESFNEAISYVLAQITNSLFLKITILVGLWVLSMILIIIFGKKYLKDSDK